MQTSRDKTIGLFHSYALDISYVINPDGYLGKSVSVDIGYALTLALGRQVYSMAPIEDPPVGDLIEGVARPEEIIDYAS